MQKVELIAKRLRNHWQILLQISAWILTILVGFILPPPLWDFEQHQIWYKFAHFLVAALIGLLFIPLSRRDAKRDTGLWLVTTILALVFGVTAFFYYQSLRDSWTIPYSKKVVVIGSHYSQDALNYKARIKDEENREVSDKELVMAAAGKTENLWDIREIQYRGRILAAIYLITIILFAISIVTLIQVLYCNSQFPKQLKEQLKNPQIFKMNEEKRKN